MFHLHGVLTYLFVSVCHPLQQEPMPYVSLHNQGLKIANIDK